MQKFNQYSIGIGDRFTHQAQAQLKAVLLAQEKGVSITPVWNKSYREHQIIGSVPATTRRQADLAVAELGWSAPYFLDADHINLGNVDFFIASCDFYTIDVADYIGKPASLAAVDHFVWQNKKYVGTLRLPGISDVFEITLDLIRQVAEKYLFAVQQAAVIYRHIERQKGAGNFITEISMDETSTPQTPVDLFFILAALAQEKIPVQTIAPKFSGRFNKGVDYVGDLANFRTEFEQDVAAIKRAIVDFQLPANLKLSVHSGSDKFSLYPIIREIIQRHDAGLHLKTAGTTWLEELIGLAEAGGDGLEIAKEIYRKALEKFDELCAPYATVIDIDRQQLPPVKKVDTWDGPTFAATLRHNPGDARYNLHFRQLLHVGYKVAAEMGERYLNALEQNAAVIGKNVTENIFERHVRPLFL